MKLDFLPEFLTRSISNSELNDVISKAESLFNEKLTENGKQFFRINYRDSEEIYKNNSDMQELMIELSLVLRGSNIRDAVETAKILSNELYYFVDILKDAPLWDIIQEKIEFNLHIMTFQEKVKTLFALTFRSPKKCSFELRSKILMSLVNTDMTGIPLKDLLMFSYATRNDSSRDFAHYKFYDTILKRENEINSSSIFSSLPVDVLYSFMNNRIRPGVRRKLQYPDEEIEEEINILEMLTPAIRERIPALSTSALFRLISALSIARINGYSDLKFAVLRRIKKNIKNIDHDVFIEMLKMAVKSNRDSGIGDKDFWDFVQEYVETEIEGFLQLPDLKLQFEIMRILCLQNRLQIKTYFKYFESKVNAYLENPNREWDCLYSITQTLTMFNLNYPKNKKFDLRKLIMSLLFSNKYWTYRQHYFFKAFHQLIKLREPEWNLISFDVFGYHAEKEFDTWKLKKSLMTPELQQILVITQTNLDLKLIPLVDHENTFLIDLANNEMKLAIFLKTKENTLSSSRLSWEDKATESEDTIFRKIYKEILLMKGWHIYELDFAEFLEQKENRADWLLEEMKREFGLAIEKRPDPYVDIRKEIEDYNEAKTMEEFEHATSTKDSERRQLYIKHQKYIKENPQLYIGEEKLEKEL